LGALYILQSLFALLLMAVALGMDALSVGMGMGMIPLRLKQIIKIGLTIGVFHVIMPLLGMLIGDVLSQHFGKLALLAGGVLLLLLGAQMIFYSFRKNEHPMIRPVGFGLVLFALSVSLDSFSVGLSLGIYGAKIVVTVFLFGFVSMMMTWIGLLIGRKVQKLLGSYSEALGGCVLFAFGIKFLLHI